ncbi:YoaK family protein [Streptomyces sp. NPDC006463]|uniref:YoaK family protein n=1 Tax=Streptomyces sp. NPDC006463 TaxID=3364746 RepID=UPI00368A2DDA
MNVGAHPVRPSLAGLMIVLTGVTGLVEAVSLLALGPVFTAMQTGNVLFLAFGLARQGNLPALSAAASVTAFAAGAVCGARMESAADARGWRWAELGLYVEAALILAGAATGWGVEPRFGHPSAEHLAVTGMLAAAMGIRTVTSMRVNVPGVPTTLITRSLTALIGSSALGRDSAFGYGTGAWVRRAGAVLAMFVGGLTGALLIGAGWKVGALLVPAAALVLAVGLSHRVLPQPHGA